MKTTPEFGAETASLLVSGPDNLYFLLIIVPLLLLLFYYEHRRQLKKFKKVWKDRVDTCLLNLKESHRKRLNAFKVQPMAMKAEWSTLKSQMTKRMDELHSLKIDVNNQLASLKLDFQRQSAHLITLTPLPLPPSRAPTNSYLDCKFGSLKDYVDQQIARTKYMHEVTAKLLQVSPTTD